MTPDRWQQIRRVVEEAMLLPAARRFAYLDSLGLDEGFRADAEQLLAFGEDASEIFSLDGWKIWANPRVIEEDLSGQLVGTYKLLEEIGRGGMGTVYRAERADGEFEKEVAIKVLQEGISTEALVKRFREERQILASLSHPGIAQLLDGGITQDGRPYLVLEYVQGRPIDRYCVEEKLGTAAKLRLFLLTAEAVQAAHQQAVLHLDLKPANILVTNNGKPRLLDFGVSRLLVEGESRGREGEVALRILTPRYASPEQMTGGPLGVASDVFSLGTLLYRLLTGKFPYPFEDAPPLEISRVLREVEPQAPSSVAPPEIALELRGDLDAILLHALQKEPGSRYSTVAMFVEDIKRHLDSRPVLAHADHFHYRLGKFLRRHHIAASLVTGAFVVLLGSVIAVAHAVTVAQREHDTAERRLRDVRALAHSYIFDLAPELEDIPGTLKVRNEVVQRGFGYLEAMSKEGAVDSDLEHELAAGYLMIGRIQGDSKLPSLGDQASGWESLNKSLEMQRRIAAKDPKNLVERGRIVSTLITMANMQSARGDIAGARKTHLEAWETGQPLLVAGPKATKYYFSTIGAAWFVGQAHDSDDSSWHLADPEAAMEWFERASTLMKQWTDAHPEDDGARALATRTGVMTSQAIALQHLGREEEALEVYEDTMAILDPEALRNDVLTADHWRFVHLQYARLLLDRGNLRGAIAASANLKPEALKHVREVGKDSIGESELAELSGWDALLKLHSGQQAEGLRAMDKSLVLMRKAVADNPEIDNMDANLARNLIDFSEAPKMDPARSLPMLKEAIGIAEKFANQHPEAMSARLLIGRAELDLAKIALKKNQLVEAKSHATSAVAHLSRVRKARPSLSAAQLLLASSQEMLASGPFATVADVADVH